MLPSDKLQQLRGQGVVIPDPQTIQIGEDVPLERIVGPNTVIHPGTRLRGSNLSISAGCQLGAESPATVEDCALGTDVELKGGYFARSTFLAGASMGSGAHVRAGCLLEEQANGAHTVGLKQTVLLPFVTLGSLINFCDVLMAGGTSRRDHSEVGSSFIHFNFTPYGRHGDKATPSLIGDVPHGVMLRSPRIFLGGQAGLVGPLRIDFGTVLAAGYVYRRDHGPGSLVIGEPFKPATRSFSPLQYGWIKPRLVKNLTFIGNLTALWHWYEQVRLPLVATGDQQLQRVYRSAQNAIETHLTDRVKQLERLADAMHDSISELTRESGDIVTALIAQQRAFAADWPAMKQRLSDWRSADDGTSGPLGQLREGLQRCSTTGYLETIAALDDDAMRAGVSWLTAIVERVVALADTLPS